MPGLRSFARELYRRDPLLAVVGWFHIVAVVAVAAVAPFDDRLILGLNPWVKPSKFLISIGIYLWTVAWFMPYLRATHRMTRLMSIGVSAMMLVESVCITLQSVRGVRSHFNDGSVFDQSVYGLMGLGIVLNTVLLAVLAALLFARYDRTLPRPYLWAVRLGLVLTLAGSAEGAVMVVNGAHSIAVADGGDGLPYVNWSTEGGDLRVAHAIGLHGLQVLPLFAFFLGRCWPGLHQRRQLAIVCGFASVYAAVGIALFAQAMAGRPTIAGSHTGVDLVVSAEPAKKVGKSGHMSFAEPWRSLADQT